MKLRFKRQQFQEDAIASVCDVFKDQPNKGLVQYEEDPGEREVAPGFAFLAYRNGDVALTDDAVKANVKAVQAANNVILPNVAALEQGELFGGAAAKGKRKKTSKKSGGAAANVLNLEVEMETGTGKTFTYLKTIYELNRRYGWSRFIIIVPSIAIREGVAKTIEATREWFKGEYENLAESFVYSSDRLGDVRSFTTGSHIEIMVMNVQAFNARTNTRIINKDQDRLDGLRPIDVIAATRPILILDEPQRMEGDATQEALGDFKPLFIVRYSATHKTIHNLVYRLDAIDAFERKLVKQIAPVCIEQVNKVSGEAYVYCSDVRAGKAGPEALLSFNKRLANGETKNVTMLVRKGDDLKVKAGGLEAYDDRFVVSDMSAKPGFESVTFSNGLQLFMGQAAGNVDETQFRRIQIREAIRAHLKLESQMYPMGVKVLTLFFIDEVKKYRVYEGSSTEGTDGEYARIFEEEYPGCLAEAQDLFTDAALRAYQDPIPPDRTHKGYFAQDKKAGRFKDSDFKKAEKGNNEEDVAAYDLILKEKERLLSFEETTRFIFSHSALREGWDNPNVFVICPLKNPDSGNTVARRQEVGRGLRLCVNQRGERQDADVLGEDGVHEVNRLTVISNENYGAFVGGLQKEIEEACAAHRRIAVTAQLLSGQHVKTADGTPSHELTEHEAKQIYKWMLKNDFLDDNDEVSAAWGKAVKADELPPLPEGLENMKPGIVALVNAIDMNSVKKVIESGKPKPLKRNKNFSNPGFKALWEAIRPKTVYHVDFESGDLIEASIKAINQSLDVPIPRYTVREGVQTKGDEFEETKTKTAGVRVVKGTFAPFDLVGRVAKEANLTRRTVAAILKGIDKSQFAKFELNPERFIGEVSKTIRNQFSLKIVEHLQYEILPDGRKFDEGEVFDGRTILPEQMQNLCGEGKTTKHIYDWLATDSKEERSLAKEMELSDKIEVYAKLPQRFSIPTPFGDYNPDWAVVFKRENIRHIYFIAETKGDVDVTSLRDVEKAKIACAKKHFETLSKAQNVNVVYEAVTCKTFFNRVDELVVSG